MSGYSNCNREEFNEEADHQLVIGNIPLNPAILPAGLTQGEYMQLCLPMVAISDQVVMLEGWETSEGARIEHQLAIKSAKPVTYRSSRPRYMELPAECGAVAAPKIAVPNR